MSETKSQNKSDRKEKIKRRISHKEISAKDVKSVADILNIEDLEAKRLIEAENGDIVEAVMKYQFNNQ